MTRYEDSNRELFDVDGILNTEVAKKLFNNEEIIISVLEKLDDASFKRAQSAIQKVADQKK